MEDRKLLEVIQSLAAEERRLRQAVQGGASDPQTAERLDHVTAELRGLWRRLREQRENPESVDLTEHEQIAI